MNQEPICDVPPPKRRFSDADRQACVRRWQDSGLSMLAFCRREGLNAKTIGQWKRRLLGSAAPAAPARPFVAVTLTPPERTGGTGGGRMRLVLVGRERIVLPPDFDDQALRRLLAVLDARNASASASAGGVRC
jgi:hypothetical protein